MHQNNTLNNQNTTTSKRGTTSQSTFNPISSLLETSIHQCWHQVLVRRTPFRQHITEIHFSFYQMDIAQPPALCIIITLLPLPLPLPLPLLPTTTTTTTTKSQPWSVPSIRGLIKHQIEYRGGANGVMRCSLWCERINAMNIGGCA